MGLRHKFKSSAAPPQPESITYHDSDAAMRKVTFAASDGTMLFLNYAYLVSGTYAPEEDAITLNFTTHVVTLKGHRLAGLFDSLTTQAPRQIAAVEERYAATIETESVVTHIAVEVL